MFKSNGGYPGLTVFVELYMHYACMLVCAGFEFDGRHVKVELVRPPFGVTGSLRWIITPQVDGMIETGLPRLVPLPGGCVEVWLEPASSTLHKALSVLLMMLRSRYGLFPFEGHSLVKWTSKGVLRKRPTFWPPCSTIKAVNSMRLCVFFVKVTGHMQVSGIVPTWLPFSFGRQKSSYQMPRYNLACTVVLVTLFACLLRIHILPGLTEDAGANSSSDCNASSLTNNDRLEGSSPDDQMDSACPHLRIMIVLIFTLFSCLLVLLGYLQSSALERLPLLPARSSTSLPGRKDTTRLLFRPGLPTFHAYLQPINRKHPHSQKQQLHYHQQQHRQAGMFSARHIWLRVRFPLTACLADCYPIHLACLFVPFRAGRHTAYNVDAELWPTESDSVGRPLPLTSSSTGSGPGPGPGDSGAEASPTAGTSPVTALALILLLTLLLLVNDYCARLFSLRPILYADAQAISINEDEYDSDHPQLGLRLAQLQLTRTELRRQALQPRYKESSSQSSDSPFASFPSFSFFASSSSSSTFASKPPSSSSFLPLPSSSSQFTPISPSSSTPFPNSAHTLSHTGLPLLPPLPASSPCPSFSQQPTLVPSAYDEASQIPVIEADQKKRPFVTPLHQNLPCLHRFRDNLETSALLADIVVIGWPERFFQLRNGPLYNVSFFVESVLKRAEPSIFPVRNDFPIRTGPFSRFPDKNRCWTDVHLRRRYILFVERPDWAGYCRIMQLPVEYTEAKMRQVRSILRMGCKS
ncbi:unnamed protein product [Protopolystoma xenopodis]|uniref:Uncharacterized protein n=1 Tax=Protopolystoma xenopodis TaxID=117903 RepID=A0A448WGS0_9PLAT|nr:unnamed protein product [Protopolystoma xenopodis]